MAERLRENEVAKRLPYLLIFRAVVATLLVLINVVAGVVGWPVTELTYWLSAVAVATYVVVLVLGAMLRGGDINPLVLGATHLATAVMATMFIVQLTGGIQSPFSFLYLLVILDGAIIGGRSIALVVATFSVIAFGAQLAMQLYGLWLAPSSVTELQFLRSFLVHGIGFYATALLSGYLAHLIEGARAEVDSVQDAYERVAQQQREVLASLPVGVVTLTEDFVVVSANPRARAILDADDVIGSLVPDAFFEVLSGEESTGEVRYRDRVLSVTRAEATAVRTVSTQPLLVMVLEDRTEVHALESEVRQNERLAALGALSAAMAHEIRNPLAGLSGAIELIFADPDDEASRERLEGVVHREIQRLNKLISDFLSYARPTEPNKRIIELPGLVREVCVMAEREGGHSVSCEIQADARIWADAEQARQVLWNLLRNAFDASPEGASVEVQAEREGSRWRVDVIDHGTGLDPAIRHVLYEPFRTTKPSGTGLGLALVHRIMESHGGRIQLSDAEGGGTRASVWWIAAESEARDRSTRPAPGAAQGAS